jgi:hypothetical protein
VLFALGAKDAVDGIGRTMGWFVIVTDLHFTEQADGQQVQSGEQ